MNSSNLQNDSDNLWNNLIASENKPVKELKETHNIFPGQEKNMNSNIHLGQKSEENADLLHKDWFNDEQIMDCWFSQVPDIASNSDNFLGLKQDKLDRIQPKNQQIAQHFINIDPFLNKILDHKPDESKHFNHIFQTKSLKLQKKNTNLPKFIVRVFIKHFHPFNSRKHYKFSQIYKRVKKSIQQHTTNNYNIRDILRIFEYSSDVSQQTEFNSRQVMARILRNTKKEQIINNSYINNNMYSYMLATQIYSIRCRSKVLSERVKIT